MSDVSMEGVSLNCLRSFVQNHGERLGGLTIQHFCREIIEPLTSQQFSYTAYLKKQAGQSGYVNRATHFVSCPRRCKFLNLVRAISEWEKCKGTGNEFFWIDVFSLDQHERIQDFPSWSVKFKQIIKRIGKGIFVLSPWDAWKQPIWQERAWCLYEFYLFFSYNLKREFVILNEDRRELILAMERGKSYEDILSLINLESAEASIWKEGAAVKLEVKEDIGFGRFNQIVRVALKRELIPIIKAASDSIESDYPLTLTQSNVQFMHAKLLMEMQGDDDDPNDRLKLQQGYIEAEQLLRRRLVDLLGGCRGALAERTGGLSYLANLTSMLRPQERSTEKDSHDEMRSQRRRWRRNLGLSENSRFGTQSESDEENPDPLLLAESMQHFAEVNELLGRTWDAVEWLDAAVKLQGYRLDQSDPVLAESKKRLAEALRRVGQCDKAIKVLEDVADVLKKTRPDEPVLAADANASMANILLQAKRYDEAAELYRTALQDQQRARGAMHPSVAETLVNLGAAQRGQKSTAKALATYARAEKILRAQMKITGPLRLAALLRNMAVAHATDGDLDMAVERYEEAVELQRLHALGDGRAVLAETLAGLADVHKNRGELALTVKLYAEAVREREGLLNMWIREVDMRPDLGGNDLQGASVGDFGGKIAQEGVAALQAVCDAVLSAVVLREGGPRPSAEDSRRCRDMRLRPLYAGLASARHSLAIALMHLGDAQGTDAGTGEFQEAEELIEIVLRYRAALADTATLRPRQAGGGKDREQDGSGEGGDGGGEAGGDQEDLQLAESLAAKGALLRRRRQFDAGRAYLERALALCKKHKLPLDDRRIEFIESVLG